MWDWVERFDRGRRFPIWAIQILVFALSGLFAFLLRFDLQIPNHYLPHLAYAISIWIVAKIVAFRLVNLGRGWWRYVSARDLIRIALGNAGGSILGAVLILLIAPPGFPRSIYLLDGMICLLGTAGVRLAVRLTWEAVLANRKAGGRKRTLIYGAGSAGMTLLREIQNNPRLPYDVRGFIDDRPEKKGANLLGSRVLGAGEQVQMLAASETIDQILIAIPSATRAEMTRIVDLCQSAGVECRTVPGLDETIRDQALAAQIRDVAIEDILGRESVHLEQQSIRERVEGTAVMVTGAAGSIGSEVCRQLARFDPAVLIAFDMNETGLFHLEREINGSFPCLCFRPEIGNIQNTARLEEVMRRYSPAAVFHAAAYKHVPLMEAHVCEAVENNILGTYNTARAAIRNGVRDFVLISSDKAVRPVGVMGATKRAAELLTLALNAQHDTKFVCVRFGNVLGSNGSVIPIFKEQIAAGGPVTVTHPEVERYFMTVSEAAQLALQAFSMGNGGEIFVLEMGAPVQIVELARKMIRLCGLVPGRDIEITFTGLRPGEKMYEELSVLNEGTAPTRHEKIRIFVGSGLPHGIDLYIDRLRTGAANRDGEALAAALEEMVRDYVRAQPLQHDRVASAAYP